MSASIAPEDAPLTPGGAEAGGEAAHLLDGGEIDRPRLVHRRAVDDGAEPMPARERLGRMRLRDHVADRRVPVLDLDLVRKAPSFGPSRTSTTPRWSKCAIMLLIWSV